MAQIRYLLDDLLKKYNISANRLAVETKQRPETVRAMRNNRVRRMNEGVLVAICGYFAERDANFTLCDLIVYEHHDVPAILEDIRKSSNSEPLS